MSQAACWLEFYVLLYFAVYDAHILPKFLREKIRVCIIHAKYLLLKLYFLRLVD